jgi:hypothetical protein
LIICFSYFKIHFPDEKKNNDTIKKPPDKSGEEFNLGRDDVNIEFFFSENIKVAILVVHITQSKKTYFKKIYILLIVLI